MTEILDDESITTLRARKKHQTWQSIHEMAMQLVMERGLAGVTVEEICAEVPVSPRTFFNYFSSKANAALGLTDTVIPDSAREEFLRAEGTLVDDLCGVVASLIRVPSDHRQLKEMLEVHGDLVPCVLEHMASARETILLLAEERVDKRTARLAVALVMAALVESVYGAAPLPRDQAAERIRQDVRALVAVTEV